jgi:hypothetical protein
VIALRGRSRAFVCRQIAERLFEYAERVEKIT